MTQVTRRQFLGAATAGVAMAAHSLNAFSQASPAGLDFPIEDYHVHLNA